VNLGREIEPVHSLRRRCQSVTEVQAGRTAGWTERMEKLQSLHAWVAENLEQAHRKQASYYNLRRRDRVFGVGELVLRRQHILSSAAQNVAAKLAPKFCRPVKIKRVLSPVVYELEGLDGVALGKVHVQDLKPYRFPSTA